MKIFIANFFISSKLYLLICSKVSFIWGSALGPIHHPLCSLKHCLSLEALTALDNAQGKQERDAR